MAGLSARADTVLATWQERRNDEPNLPTREFAQLALLSHIAWGDDLIRPAPSRQDPRPHELASPASEIRVPLQVFPTRTSPSQVELLAFCPYRFAVATVLGLNELDDVAEELDHRATGQRLHEILYRFHGTFPDLLALTEAEACAALEKMARAAFAEDIEDSWNDFPRLAHFLRRVPAYVGGQPEWAAQGWRPEALERRLAWSLTLGDGDRIELVGRIDRIDRRPKGGYALIDYKNQTRKALTARIRFPERDVNSRSMLGCLRRALRARWSIRSRKWPNGSAPRLSWTAPPTGLCVRMGCQRRWNCRISHDTHDRRPLGSRRRWWPFEAAFRRAHFRPSAIADTAPMRGYAERTI